MSKKHKLRVMDGNREGEVIKVDFPRGDVRYEMVPVDLIKPNPFQPRVVFDEEKLRQMAETIKINGGVEDDIHLTDNKNGTFTIINGERRWRATKMAGLKFISAKISLISRERLLEKACLANFCVAEMTLVEQAFAFKALMEEHGWSQSELARRIGKSQGTISNALKIFNLDKDIQAGALYGKIAPGIALRLASFEENDQKILLSACKKEIDKRGKPFAPNELLFFLRKTAENLGIKTRGKSEGRKISRKTLPHHSLLARSVERLIEKLSKEIKELAEAKPFELREMKDPMLSGIIGLLENLEELIAKKLKTFEAIQDGGA